VVGLRLYEHISVDTGSSVNLVLIPLSQTGYFVKTTKATQHIGVENDKPLPGLQI